MTHRQKTTRMLKICLNLNTRLTLEMNLSSAATNNGKNKSILLQE